MRGIWLFGAAFALAGCNAHVNGATFTEGPDALRCSARVLAIGDTGATINDDPLARLTLRVSPAHGAGPFEATIETTVSRLAIPRVGDTIPVVCDPANPGNTKLID
jgi:hypothetical protein